MFHSTWPLGAFLVPARLALDFSVVAWHAPPQVGVRGRLLALRPPLVLLAIPAASSQRLKGSNLFLALLLLIALNHHAVGLLALRADL